MDRIFFFKEGSGGLNLNSHKKQHISGGQHWLARLTMRIGRGEMPLKYSVSHPPVVVDKSISGGKIVVGVSDLSFLQECGYGAVPLLSVLLDTFYARL